MFEQLFRGLFDTDMTVVISPQDFLVCVGVSLLEMLETKENLKEKSPVTPP